MGFFLNRTLGKSLKDDKEKKKVSLVYYEPEKVLNELDDISWTPPMVPTPFVGSAPMPGKHGNATINFMQFRNKDEIIIPKPNNTYRIFIIGGSTAFGAGASSQEKTISGYLNKILNEELSQSTGLNYEIINAANCAWVSTHERILIENRLCLFEPDLVISISGINDVHWGKLGRNVLWFRTYADDFFLKLINKVREASEEPHLPEILEIDSKKISSSIVAKRLFHNVKLSSLVLSMYKIPYLFVLQPTGKVINYSRDEYFCKCYSKIHSYLKEFKANNFYYLDLSKMFDNLQGPFFIDPYHFGDRGNKMIANNIFKHLLTLLQKMDNIKHSPK
ncbi:MAG: SGNH/GDSL hydrolase family protein [Candidatus Lokiarchaeota archaeon]|nr:SGNH/GDSL hydrolase family protein [Candidatus Lokiarchaeota archaeon]